MVWAIVAGLVLVGAVCVQVLPSFVWRGVVRRRVVVVLRDERAIAGVLVSRRGPLLTLADASTTAAGKAVGFDGRVVIERDRVAWIQVAG